MTVHDIDNAEKVMQKAQFWFVPKVFFLIQKLIFAKRENRIQKYATKLTVRINQMRW